VSTLIALAALVVLICIALRELAKRK